MKKRFYFILAIACVLLASCASRRNYVYLNDMNMGVEYPYDTDHEAVVRCGDRLKIVVNSKSPELAIPFNMNAGTFKVNEQGDVVKAGAETSALGGYKVDKMGEIQFPVLGKLYVDGLKISEVSDLIRSQIIEKKYIKEPMVDIEFLNFKYVMLGAVQNNGTFTVEGDRITLLEAIAKAGNVTPNASLNRVMVIREQGGKRTVFAHDLRSKDIFDSPCFYLQQNDVVYVEPKSKPTNPNEDRFLKYFTIFLSLVTATTSILWLTTK